MRNVQCVLRKYELDIFILIDALGWSYLDGREFLSDILPFRSRLRTVLGFSSGAIPTILTGLSPARNGNWNLLYYDPDHSPFRWLRHFLFLPDVVLDHRMTSKILTELGRRVLGLGPLFSCAVSPRVLPWFNWIERRNIYAPGGIPGAWSIFDELAKRLIPHRVYSYHHLTDSQILRRASKDIESGEYRFLFLYLCELDMFLHNHCLDSGRLGQRLDWYERHLRELCSVARRVCAAARITICSDHGMTPVRELHDLKRDVDGLGFRMPEDYLAVYDSTMVRFWFFSDGARQRITERLGASPCGRILGDAELKRCGVLFEDRRYGEIVFLLHPGWLLARSDFHGPRWVPAGMHGYHPDDPYSDAVFLSSAAPEIEVSTIADVYECMLQSVS